MNIPIQKLKTIKTYITREEGYRIVYYYEKYHEAPQGIYAKNIKDFMNEFKANDIVPKFISNEDILNRFLEKNKDALGVAIYNVDGTPIERKNKETEKNINNTEVYKEELIYDYGDMICEDGYRLVYYYDDHYSIGEYSKNIESFMIGLCEIEPIIDESDIPEFVSVDDLLIRCLNILPNIESVALYKVDGTLVAEKSRNQINIK